MEVKDILRIKRLENDMTMKELADKVGVSEGTISRWESGDIANMKRDKIVALANALGISPLLIMGIDEPKRKHRDSRDDELLQAFHSIDSVTQGIILKILGIDKEMTP